ncbi:hypothetical protein LXL04_021536 [Taraxacum kok-saghyz]
MSLVSENPCRRFPLDAIQKATDNFHESKIIGEGGFGRVYKGVIDDESTSTQTLVAVKRLDPKSTQGIGEFETEIKMLSKCRHCNLVNLVGYCNELQEMILVYEYISQGNLADHLYRNQGSKLTWEQRLNICIGAARGLDYLHSGTGITDRIIHLDVKSDNILIDENWAAKIADLGLSKIGPANQPHSEVHTVNVRGTRGYVDPEYVKSLKYSRKADVYSFGVVLLEVLSGTSAWSAKIIPNHDLIDRAEWIQKHITNGTLNQVIDPIILSKIQPECLKRFAYTAFRSLQNDPQNRPSMSEVVAQLESVLKLQNGDVLRMESEDPETSMGISIKEYLGKAQNLFGEPIGDKTMIQMGLDPTRENKARVAYKMMKHDNKYEKALCFVKDLKAKWGNGIMTLCMIYNATGETLTYVTSRNRYGDIGPSPYPIIIMNGQWGAYLHNKTQSMCGSVAAVVYRGKYSDNSFCDRMITWSNRWQRITQGNAAYCEINEVGHFDVTDWEAIFHKAKLVGPKSSSRWNNCYTMVKIESDTSALCEAIFTHVDALPASINKHEPISMRRLLRAATYHSDALPSDLQASTGAPPSELRRSSCPDARFREIHVRFLKAIHELGSPWSMPRCFHRYCLRHFINNFHEKFRNSDLKKLAYRAGSQNQIRKFNSTMEEIGKLNPQARQWLENHPFDRWTLAHDGGKRYGLLTTNLSEIFNSVLKGSFDVKIAHSLRAFNREKGLFELITQRGGACAKLSLNSWQYIDRCYSIVAYCDTWASEFLPVPHQAYWPHSLFGELLPNIELLRNKKGRPRSTRLRNGMDIKERRSANLCGISMSSNLFQGLPPPSARPPPPEQPAPPPSDPAPAKISPTPPAPALKSALKRSKPSDSGPEATAPKKSLRFKTIADTSETQVIDAMKKICTHINNASKFSKASKLAIQLIQSGSVKPSNSDFFFAILESAMSSTTTCNDPRVRADYHALFVAAEDLTEIFTQKQQKHLSLWSIRAVMANDLFTDDSFVFSKACGRIKEAISNLPVATKHEDMEEAASLKEDDSETVELQQNSSSNPTPESKEESDPFGLDALIPNAPKKDEIRKEEDEEEEEAKRFLKSEREALILCLEFAAKRYKIPWCQTVIDITVKHAFDNVSHFTCKQRNAIEKLWASIREQQTRRKQGKSVSGKLDVNGFEWLQQKYSTEKISIRHSVGGNTRRAEQWLG